VLAHGSQAHWCASHGLNPVIAIRLQAVEQKHFLQLNGKGGGGCIDNHDLAAKVFNRNVGRLGNQFVSRTFTTHHDGHIHMGPFDQGHRVIHGGVGKIRGSRCQGATQRFGIGGDLRLDLQAVLFESLLFGREGEGEGPRGKTHNLQGLGRQGGPCA